MASRSCFARCARPDNSSPERGYRHSLMREHSKQSGSHVRTHVLATHALFVFFWLTSTGLLARPYFSNQLFV